VGEWVPDKVICDAVGETNGEEDGDETLFEPNSKRTTVVGCWFCGHCCPRFKKGRFSLTIVAATSANRIHLSISLDVPMKTC